MVQGWAGARARAAAGVFAAALFASGGCGDDARESVAADPVPVTPAAPDFVADPGTQTLAAALDTVGGGDGAGGDGAGDGGAGGGAGDGGAIRNASVALTCGDGTTRHFARTTERGAWFVRFKVANCVAPYLVKVTDAAGNVYASVGDTTPAAGRVVPINVTPLTDKVVSDILPASVRGTAQEFAPSDLRMAALPAAKQALVASIRAALAATGIASPESFDPIRSLAPFDGRGVDAVLESIAASRHPVTGATELRAKLVGVGDGANAEPAPIAAATPLAPALLNLNAGAWPSFAKMEAWIGEMNRCLALTPAALAADPNCPDRDGSRLISSGYLNDGYDFASDFKVLMSGSRAGGTGFSAPAATHVVGSTLRNPVLLFVGKYVGSTSAVDDLALVQVTIRQPGTGPNTDDRDGIPGSLSTPIEYTKFLYFRRDDTLGTSARGGNWILHGNQRSIEWTLLPAVFSWTQQNPARAANAAGGQPSGVASGVRIEFSARVFDPDSGTMVHNDVYAVRVTGPGLPDAGIVLAPSVNLASRLAVLNKTGAVPPPPSAPIARGIGSITPAYAASIGLTTAEGVLSDFRMSGVALPSGEPLNAAVWPSVLRNFSADPAAVDYSKLSAYSRYVAEIFRGTSRVPVREATWTLASIPAPTVAAGYARTDLAPSAPTVTPPQSAAAALDVLWRRVVGAPRIESGYVIASAPGALASADAPVPDAFTLSPASTSVSVTGAFPAMGGAQADFRELGVAGRHGRMFLSHGVRWNN